MVQSGKMVKFDKKNIFELSIPCEIVEIRLSELKLWVIEHYKLFRSKIAEPFVCV